MYCVDLNHSFAVPSNWPVNVNRTGMIYGFPVNNAGQIGYLVDNYAPGKLDADHSAAMQAAIWSVEYGSNFFNFSASGSVTSLFNTFAGYVTGNNSGNTGVIWLDPTGLNNLGQHPQGFVTPTPEPASLLLWSGLVVGFGLVRNLKRARRPVE